MLVDVSHLSVAERIQLVEELWDSIAETPDAVPVTQAQRDELDQRLASYAAAPSEGKDWEQVKRAIQQRSAR
jgi:putative addiction module component (TIGR02574 family)